MPVDGHYIVPKTALISLSPFHNTQLVEVKLSSNDAHYMSGGGDNAQFMLSKSQIEELCQPLSISFIKSNRVPPVSEDEKNIVLWKITAVLETDGKVREVERTYELDLRLKDVDGVDGGFIQFLRMQKRDAENRAKKDASKHYQNMPPRDAPQEAWDIWVEEQAMRDWTMVNRHRIRRAETGATLAAARTSLGIKSTYSKKDFESPFIIVQSTINWERALQYGGEVGMMALKTLGMSFTRQLGMPEDFATGLLENVKELKKDSGDMGPMDLLPAKEDDIENLISEMVVAGFPNRSACDQRALDIFNLPLSQFTHRHVSIVREYIELSAMAKANLDEEDFNVYKEDIKDVMRICYATGKTLEDSMELSMWDKIHGGSVIDAEQV